MKLHRAVATDLPRIESSMASARAIRWWCLPAVAFALVGPVPVARRGRIRVAAAAPPESSDLEEEKRIRAELESFSFRPGEGRKWGKRLSPAREKRRRKRHASFEESQAISVELGRELERCRREGERLGDDARDLLDDLISTTSGARGWFVVLLTSPEFGALFSPAVEPALLEAIAAKPEPNLRLCVMNVAMSAATALAHDARGHADLAAASRETGARSSALVAALLDDMAGLRDAVAALAAAAGGGDDDGLDDLEKLLAGEPNPDREWRDFLDKWGYDGEQRAEIRRALRSLLDDKKLGMGTPLWPPVK